VARHLRPGVLLSRRLAALLLALAAPTALACPVCGLGASDQSQGAYIGMSIVISLVPLACIGGIVAWVALRIRAHHRAEREHASSALTRFAPDATRR
jgi:hypothetical protein